jgi:hypothetical protein
MEVILHPAPRRRDIVLEQVRVLGLSLRREALVVAVVLAVATLIVGGELARGGPGFDSSDPFPTALVSFLFPFAVWKSEKRFGPAFLWTLPVDRRRLALVKVFAGWVWLMAAMAVFVAWLLALALIARVSFVDVLMRLPFTATTATYLLGSALVLGLRHPLRWLLGTAGLFFLVGSLSQTLERSYGVQTLLGSRGLFSAVEAAVVAWQTLPDGARWALSTFLWLGAGFIALWAAASRHGERRRQ